MLVFFVLTGLLMSVEDFGVHGVLITVIVIIAASAAKILSVYATASACKMSSQDSWELGLLMNTRGLTELVISDVGRPAGVFPHRVFTVLTVMVIGMKFSTGPLMEEIYFSNTAPPVWLTKWRVRRGRLTLPFPSGRLFETNSDMGNRTVGAWPSGHAAPYSPHHDSKAG